MLEYDLLVISEEGVWKRETIQVTGNEKQEDKTVVEFFGQRLEQKIPGIKISQILIKELAPGITICLDGPASGVLNGNTREYSESLKVSGNN